MDAEGKWAVRKHRDVWVVLRPDGQLYRVRPTFRSAINSLNAGVRREAAK